jgi:hypothetical protein
MNWMNVALWDFTRYALSLGAVAVSWVPLMNYFHGEAVPTFIISIPVLWGADQLVLHGLMPLLHWKRE